MIHNRPELYFPLRWLSKPSPGWTVDWDAVDHTTPAVTLTDPTSYRDCTYMAGILIKHGRCGRVWRLTGECVGHGTPDEKLLGRWPD